jgi:hypothetical protein
MLTWFSSDPSVFFFGEYLKPHIHCGHDRATDKNHTRPQPRSKSPDAFSARLRQHDSIQYFSLGSPRIFPLTVSIALPITI